MKKILAVCLALVLLAGCGVTASNTSSSGESVSIVADVRNVKFGMGKEAVRQAESEGELADESDDKILYTGIKVSGFSTSLLYQFNDTGELHTVSYILEENHTNDNQYITDYEKLVEGLVKKYGDPTSADIQWHNDLYKNSPDDYGFAVSAGHLTYIGWWKRDDFNIGSYMSGDNFKISTVIVYTSTLVNAPTDKDSGL